MKTYVLLFLFVSACLLNQNGQAQNTGYKNFNSNWLFTESDSPDYRLTNYNPSSWQSINLPHDWTIEHGFSKDLEGCTGFAPGGIGWYAKIFNTEINENQKCYVVFDGVYNNAEFWLNGIRLGCHPFGYAPIYYDLTSLLAPQGKDNRLSVRVDHSRYADSRWYTGSGIYRNVKLLITDKLHIPVWGTYVTTPEVSREKATVELQVEVKNEYQTKRDVHIITEFFSPSGVQVASVDKSISLEPNQKTTIKQIAQIDHPVLWSVDSPLLYQARTHLKKDEADLEVRTTQFGIRTIRFDKEKGFYLNEVNMKIKGVCLHHDAGVVGAAVPGDVWKRRLIALKEMGCNAIRTSHNPVSDEFLDLCDELGFLVQDEFYDEWDLPKDKRYNMQDKEVDYITRGNSESFQLWAERDLKNSMLSARNHPCIFQWSIGNEIEWTYPGNRGATGIFKETNANDKIDWTLWRTEIPPHTPEQVREYWKNFPEQTFDMGETATKLAKWTREMDTTRPITANLILPTSSLETDYAKALDVIGFSYKPHKYDYFRKTYPEKPMMGTENVVRWYEWKAVLERDFIPGIFLWTGVDYMGECRAENWPTKASENAPLDVAGFPRGSYYMFKSFWRDDVPVVAMYTQTAEKSIFKKDESGKVVEKTKDYWKLAPRKWQDVNPYWNYNDGESTIVEVYSNCEEVELFQNGKSLGKQYLNDQEDRIYKWAVTYKNGTLVAKGRMGSQVSSSTLETVGAPVAIRLTPDRTTMSANNTDVVHIVAQLVDKNGREVKNADDEITFDMAGDCRFLGTDCGNTAKITNFKNKTVATEFGKCLLLLQATDVPATICIAAKSKNDGLKAGETLIEIRSE